MTDPVRHWPADGHVHSQFSWDAPFTSLTMACERAVQLGLPSLVFTDHLDFTARRIAAGVVPPKWQSAMLRDRILTPPPLDVQEYMEAVEGCRRMFPDLRILFGVELGEPHRHLQRVAAVLDTAKFDRVLASVHVLAEGEMFSTVDAGFDGERPDTVVRRYLSEVLRLVDSFDGYDALAHIDYAARFWLSTGSSGHQASDFEEEYRAVLARLAAKGKALEVNTRVPLSLDILRWWREEHGQAITFGSDAHRPDQVARRFAEATALATTAGFAPGRDPCDPWMRR